MGRETVEPIKSRAIIIKIRHFVFSHRSGLLFSDQPPFVFAQIEVSHRKASEINIDERVNKSDVPRCYLRCPLREGGASSVEADDGRDGIQGDHSHGWLSSRRETPFSSIVGSG